MEEITKLFDSLSPTVKLCIGAMLGIHALAFAAWIFMMVRERSNAEKEKQN